MADDAAGPKQWTDGDVSLTKEKDLKGTRWSASEDVDEDTPWLAQLHKAFGWELLGFICFSQHINKGLVRGFCYAAWNFVIRQYAIEADQIQIYEGVVQLPWALKPIIGFLSDCYPMFGYAKMPYLLWSTIMGTGALCMLGFYQRGLAVENVIALLFYACLGMSTIDLLTEAAYAKALRDKPKYGPSLLSFVWGGQTITGIVATVISGLVITYGSAWSLYSISAIPFASMLLPVMANWIREPCLSQDQANAQRNKVLNQYEGILLAIILLVASAILAYAGMTCTVRQTAWISIAVMVVVISAFSFMLNPVIAKVNAFGTIQSSLSLSLGSASFFFMMDTPAQYPDGPHFSVEFVSLVLPLVGSFCSIIGIYIYNKQASTWTYQKMYIVGNLLVALTCLMDVVFFLRWNLILGVPDQLFVLGSSSFQSVMNEWLWMPSVVLLGQLCPRGMEAIMYANLASCHNLGNTISNNLGAYLLDLTDVKPTGTQLETQKFDNLWFASLVSTLLPLFTVIAVPWFIPNKLNTEPILDNPNLRINDGSLMQAWQGQCAASNDADMEDDRHYS